MLETLDLTARMPKEGYREATERLRLVLPHLQRSVYERGIPVLVLFEGWFSSGRGDSIGQLVHQFDPRATRVHVTHASSEEDRLRPWQWRFWRRLPSRGRIEIFDRSWYYLLWNQRDEGSLDSARWERELQAVDEFERAIVDDGTVLIKFWLHIGPQEQKRRLKAWAKDETQRWRVSDEDWKRHRNYRRRLVLAEEMLARTNTHRAPWTLVASEDENLRRVRVLWTVAETLREALERRGFHAPLPEELPDTPPAGGKLQPIAASDPLDQVPALPKDSPLAGVDLSRSLTPEAYARRLKKAQVRLRELEFRCYTKRLPVVVVFEGWDASGKGGAIRRLTERLDPRGYAVIPIAAPSAVEKQHHYLWRFWAEVPKDGHWAVFDRSWYGRLLVERVEGLAEEDEWKRAFQEINEFERALVTHGTVVVKLWLHISPEEQLARFRRREQSPLRRHKITEEDWRNRARWSAYLAAVSEMLRHTSTTHAPWTIVEANSKQWARVKVVETVLRAIEARL